ncbi:U3 small nucleolar RNA-associated protein 14, putative [Plasmodium vinckei petteri]|uniref:U3 small nucleolar RNA-associated protein 14, putative n=1 Tax=Plasmodium vinckei petteri TaxID=138298 RepID=A0A6V7TC02_PLAVN|nr:U3 small nucleolar RNA-associated protein 14, putative [Plasmodium vinckei petteri]
MSDIDIREDKLTSYVEMDPLSIKKKKKKKNSKILKKNKANKISDKKIKKKKKKQKKFNNKEVNISEEEHSTTDNPQHFSDTQSGYSNSDFTYEEKKKKKKKITYDDEESKYSSAKFINFLKDYNENEGKKNKKNMNNAESDESGDDGDDDSAYNYLPQNNDIYKINGNGETLDITDLIGLDDNILENNIVKDIYSLKTDKKNKNKHMSVLEEQKINSQMTYIKNVEDLNKINKSYNILQNSWRIMFGHSKDENITSEEYINKNLLKRNNNLNNKNGLDNDINSGENVLVKDNQINTPKQFNVFDFEEEMKRNLEKSKMLIVSDDILKSEKEKKREQSKKIAQLKSLLAMERKKHALRKHIKSKSYRKYLRIKEKKEHEKMWDKLYSEHPELAINISNYEDEYAKKRNVINNVKKKRKIFNLLNRYKNEELKKEMLKSFQMDKEEKNMLKKIVQKTAIQQGIGEEYTLGDINSKHQEIENNILSNDSESDENNEEGSVDIENERAKNVKKELKKRNLLRFSFMKNAEEKKKNDQIYKKRKQLLEKVENKKDENDSLLNSSDDESEQNSQPDQKEISLLETPQISKLSSKEVEKAKLQLKEDIDLGNMLRKNSVLNTNNVINLDFELNEAENDNTEEKVEEKGEEQVEGQSEEQIEEESDEKPNKEKGTTKDKKINDLVDIDKINDEDVLKQYGEKLTVYNFENNIYEDYININDTINNREDEELFELSDSEKITGEQLNVNEWCNYNTLIEREQNIIKKEKEIIEKKKNMPLHTINVLNKKDKKFDVYYVDKIPYPYEKNEYEKTLNININKEVNDISTFKKLIAPQMTNKVGNIVSPLVHNPFEIANILTLRKKKNKAKL